MKIGNIVRTFYHAKIIISGHGAGLTNLLFTRENTGVVEYLCKDFPVHEYYCLGTMLGHKYAIALKGESSYNGIIFANIEETIQLIKKLKEII